MDTDPRLTTLGLPVGSFGPGLTIAFTNSIYESAPAGVSGDNVAAFPDPAFPCESATAVKFAPELTSTIWISAPCLARVLPILSGFKRGSLTSIGTVCLFPTVFGDWYLDFITTSDYFAGPIAIQFI